MTQQARGPRVHERWAHLRFSVIGQLLAAPPPKGELRAQIEALAGRQWRHPITGEPVRFGFSTIERWFYRALKERSDPVGVLRRKLRTDAGQQPAMSDAVRGGGEGTGRDEEVRSYEAAYVNGLWHWDCHHGSRKVLTARGEWQTPILFGVLDDRSRLACHLQWYLAETAEIIAHGLSQAFQKRGLPRSGLSDNGAAMTAAEITEGLSRLGVLHQTTLPYSPTIFPHIVESVSSAVLGGTDVFCATYLRGYSERRNSMTSGRPPAPGCLARSPLIECRQRPLLSRHIGLGVDVGGVERHVAEPRITLEYVA